MNREAYSVIYVDRGVVRVWNTLPTRREAEAVLREDAWGIPGVLLDMRVVPAAEAARYANR